MYIQVSIGRSYAPDRYNPTGGTLSDLDWGEFKNDIVNNLVATVLTELDKIGEDDWQEVLNQVEVHNGQGHWDGVVEESCHISIVVPGGLSERTLREFRQYLFNVKGEYAQEAIGLIVGSELI